MNTELDEYLESLINNISTLSSRQGSEAFDSIKSANQYRPAYKWILENISKTSTILDWGCGTGHFSDFLAKFGYNVIPYGFDSPNFLNHINSPALLNYVKATDKTTLPFNDQTFDLVISIGVLEHVREFGGSEISSLKEINRVLKNGGIFYCFHLPNKYSWIEVASKYLNKFYHQYRFTKSEIFDLASESNFKVVKCTSYGFIPRNIIGKNRYLKRISNHISNLFIERTDDFLEIIFSKVNQNWEVILKKLV